MVRVGPVCFGVAFTMPAPDYQNFMLCMLRLTPDGHERATAQVQKDLTNRFRVGPAERSHKVREQDGLPDLVLHMRRLNEGLRALA